LNHKFKLDCEDVIALCLEKTELSIIALLGVLKSSCVYLPVDPGFPKDRINYIFQDSKCKVVIDQMECNSFIDTENSYSPIRPNIQISNFQPAYLLYTTGTTGKPKGVLIQHSSILNYIISVGTIYKLDKGERVLQISNLTFDASLEQIFVSLISGSTLYLIRKEVAVNLEEFDLFLNHHKITHLHSVPTFLNKVNFSKNKSLRRIISAGETFVPTILNNINEDIDVYNKYGPTETTISATIHKIERDKENISKIVPIGKPLNNYKILILNRREKIVPVGVEGEIWIGGVGIAKGYIGENETYNKNFRYLEYFPDTKFYKSGDMGKWLPNGDIEFTGRIDEQLKIRGFRIEPNEIVNALNSFYNELSSITVLGKKDNENELSLVAYISGVKDPDLENLKIFLNKKLPSYMHPNSYVFLDALPLTSSGKIDKIALLREDSFKINRKSISNTSKTEIEFKLIQIWESVLQKEGIGREDDFFLIGGHSLKATKLISQIFKLLNVKLEIKQIFEVSVLKDQAKLIENCSSNFYSEIVKTKLEGPYPLSSSQFRLWVLDHYDNIGSTYNMIGSYFIEGNLNIASLELAFRSLIKRHEILRTRFEEVTEGEVRQFIESDLKVDVQILEEDLRSVADWKDFLDIRLKENLEKPFNLAAGNLIKPYLYRITDNKWVFSYVMHHIISDGWSLNIMIGELLYLYNSYLKGTENNLLPLQIQYKDYAVWQQTRIKENGFEQDRNYWIERFSGEIPILNLPTDLPRPPSKTFKGGTVRKKLDGNLVNRLKTFCLEREGTVYMGLIAAVYTFLYRFSEQSDIVIGSPIAGRNLPELEDQIGFYVNTLAMRLDLNGIVNYSDLFTEVKKMTLEAYDHQLFPFDKLIEELDLPREISRNPLFDVMVILQNTNITKYSNEVAGLNISGINWDETSSSKFDLTFCFIEYENELELALEFNSNIFYLESAERISEHFIQLLNNLVFYPTISLIDIDFLRIDEKQKLLIDFRGIDKVYANEKTVVDLFEEQVKKTPDAISIIYKDKRLTYRDLDESSNRFARFLRKHYKIEVNSLIGINLERNDIYILSLLAVLKSGAAVVPLDPKYPEERIQFIERDSRCLVTINIDLYEDFKKEEKEFNSTNLVRNVQPLDLIYLVYTSGSTGVPKGILMSHKVITNLINFHIEQFPFVKCVMQFASIGFDVSFQEIFSTLLRGATLFPISEQEKVDVYKLGDFIRLNSIETVFLPTAYFKILAEENYFINSIKDNVKYIIVAGEKLILSERSIQNLNTIDIELHNHYGPAETHVVSTLVLNSKNNIPIIPSIGKPIFNTQILILNKGKLCPIGVVGEIYIGGDAVSLGYNNLPQLTTEKFVDHPLHKGTKLYKTGDLGKWQDDGTIQYVGRIDDQVKIQGYRIEIGDIEYNLKQFPDVENAVIVTKEQGHGELSLMAYYVSQKEIKHSLLKSFLEKKLPKYMVPNEFIPLEYLPLTTNGKLDIKKLPSNLSNFSKDEDEVDSPLSKLEKNLMQLWKEVLHKDRVKLSDDFFEIGGNSISSIRLSSRIFKMFGVKFSMKNFFENPTLKEQALFLENSEKKNLINIKNRENNYKFPTTISQRRIWALCQLEDVNSAYNLPIVIEIKGKLDIGILNKTFGYIIGKYEILRSSFLQNDEGDVEMYIKPQQAFNFELSIYNYESSSKLKDAIYKAVSDPFDLNNGPLFRVSLHEEKNSSWIFVFVLHHLIGDGHSLDILAKEIDHIYFSYLSNQRIDSTPLDLQYGDYAIWHNNQKESKVFEDNKSFWLNTLKGDLPVLNLPTDFSRPKVKTFNGQTINRRIKIEDLSQFNRFCKDQKITLFVGLVTFIKYLLFKLSGQNDIIIGTPVSGREYLELEDQIGLFLDFVPLRTKIKENSSLEELVKDVKSNILSAFENRNFPVMELLAELNYQRDLGRNPLFDVLVILQNSEYTVDQTKLGKRLEILKDETSYNNKSKFDITFSFVENGGELSVNIEYNVDLFKSTSIERMLDYFEELICKNDFARLKSLKEINFLNNNYQNELLNKFNDTLCVNKSKNVIELFLNAVDQNPKNIAINYDSQTLTFAELEIRSRQLALHLKNLGVLKGALIPIFMTRSIEMIVGLFGIMRCGGAFVPIDPNYPEDRVKYMLENAHANIIISNSEVHRHLPDSHLYKVVDLDNEVSTFEVNHESLEEIEDHNLAYLIYTSGSTGDPKGVMVEHKSLLNFIIGMNDVVNRKDINHMLAITSISFDISILEIFWTICNGIPITLKKVSSDLNSFDRFLKDQETIDFSLFYFSSENSQLTSKYDLLLKSVQFADTNDFKAVWLPERHFNEFGGIFPNPAVLGAALAAVTKQISIRSGSVVLPINDVIRVAEEWSVVDNLSNGRVGLSLASGWHADDFVLAPDSFKKRHEILYDQIDQLKKLWSGGSVTRVNGNGIEKEIKIFPQPIQNEVPIYITSGGNIETFRSAGKNGAKVLTHLLGQGIEQLKNNIHAYHIALKEAGYSLDVGGVVLMLHTYIGKSVDSVKSEVRKPFKKYLKSSLGLIQNLITDLEIDLTTTNDSDLDAILDIVFERYWQSSALFGTVESVKEFVIELKSLGVDEIACLIDFGLDQKLVLDGLEHLNSLRKVFKEQPKVSADLPPIDTMQITPSYLNVLIDDKSSSKFLKSLDTLIIGGERLSEELINKIREITEANIYNMYGPTEATIWTSSKNIIDGSNITIGKPMRNTSIYILDNDLNVCPIGVIGEIYIAGDGLARGYLNSKELTNERFITHLILGAETKRLYKTGDLGKWLESGEIEIHGRVDHQIKINGFRIEPGEIETSLKKYRGIEDALVTVDKKGGEKLIAYLISNIDIDILKLKDDLQKSLPKFLIPNQFIILNKWPLTSNGKVDRSSLPSIDQIERVVKDQFIAPTGQVEKELAEIWGDVLGLDIDKISIYDSFFDLGGSSLTIIKMLNRINRKFNENLSLMTVFTLPNIAAIGEYLKKESNQNLVEEEDELDSLVETMEESFKLINRNGDE
jgi:natural product biosynthesis luciferase-like monooxygenase protein/amino acid adenylation domain-containing protein